MVLVLDLGNTNLFLGVFKDDKLVATYRTHSDKTKSSENYKEIISMFLLQNGFKINEFEGAISLLSKTANSFAGISNSIVTGITTAIAKIFSKKLKEGEDEDE